jgi:pimeloyl-ACP methyl ester carboxylesterase
MPHSSTSCIRAKTGPWAMLSGARQLSLLWCRLVRHRCGPAGDTASPWYFFSMARDMDSHGTRVDRDDNGPTVPAMFARDTITSADGTTIGYRQVGQGPGVILLHGGMMASQNFTKLGVALSDAFTVFIPDRRGRGRSGPFGNDYGIVKECEDMHALVEKTAASNVFGLSSGAIIALFAALAVPAIRKVAAYEPPFSVRGFDPAHWAPRFDRELQRGNLGAAMVTVMRGTGDSWILKLVPHSLLASLANIGIRANAKSIHGDDVPIEKLIPTMHFDALLVTETSASLEKLEGLRSEVLLLGGSKSAAFLRQPLEVLEKIAPRTTRVELPRVGHVAADNSGRPELVAASLRSFFARPGLPDDGGSE